MLSILELDKSIIFDIETVPISPSYEQLKLEMPDNFESFNYCCEYTKKDENINCEEYFQFQAGINPEYSKIVCFSFGKLHINEDRTDYNIETRSYYDDDEKYILKKVEKMLDRTEKNGFNLAGHNIKNFDIPLLIKRYIINNMKVPRILWFLNKKPWELRFLDSKEIWKFGSRTQNSSLVELALTLGIQSPKIIMNGGDVKKEYWENHNLEKIAKYCEGDVRTTTEVLVRLTDWFYDRGNHETN